MFITTFFISNGKTKDCCALRCVNAYRREFPENWWVGFEATAQVAYLSPVLIVCLMMKVLIFFVMPYDQRTKNYWDIKCISFRTCFSFWLIIIVSNILLDLNTIFLLLFGNDEHITWSLFRIWMIPLPNSAVYTVTNINLMFLYSRYWGLDSWHTNLVKWPLDIR